MYSFLGEPLSLAGRRAVELAREAGATVSVDLASIGPLLEHGRRAALTLIEDISPDLLFATAAEAQALLDRYVVDGLLDLAPTVVVKRGPKGATVLARAGEERLHFEVATEHRVAADTTGAGDAFDAGFLVGWFAARSAGRSLPSSLQRAALAGHRAAARQLSTPRPELPLV
jgi:sugar/nucleoside kinase (ribokinase family)